MHDSNDDDYEEYCLIKLLDMLYELDVCDKNHGQDWTFLQHYLYRQLSTRDS